MRGKCNFKLLVQSPEFVHEIDDISARANQCECPEKLMDELSNVLIDASKAALKMKRKAVKSRVPRYNWYNDDCKKLKQECYRLKSKLCRDPFNTHLRQQMYHSLKVFKRCCRNSKHKFRNNLLRKLECLHNKDPTSYWKVVEQLTNFDNKSSNNHRPNDNPIPPHDMFDYFKDLLGTKPDVNGDDEWLLDEVDKLENDPHFSQLDFRITETETNDDHEKHNELSDNGQFDVDDKYKKYNDMDENE